MTTITTDQAAAVRAALLDPAWQPAAGIGHGSSNACTIAKINLELTGKLTDGPHPCISEMVRRFVIRIQDVIRTSDG